MQKLLQFLFTIKIYLLTHLFTNSINPLWLPTQYLTCLLQTSIYSLILMPSISFSADELDFFAKNIDDNIKSSDSVHLSASSHKFKYIYVCF